MDGEKSIKKRLTNEPEVQEYIFNNLKIKAIEIGYGAFECEVIVHRGKISDILIVKTKESLRKGKT